MAEVAVEAREQTANEREARFSTDLSCELARFHCVDFLVSASGFFC